MGYYSGINQGYLKKVRGVLQFTTKGMEELHAMIAIGMKPDEICDFFCMEIADLEVLIGPGGQCHELYRNASAIYRRTIRQNQVALSAESAAMARHLGAHNLGQARPPVPEAPSEERRVISAMPDWDGTEADSWLANYKPERSGGSTIETLRKMNGLDEHTAPNTQEKKR